MKIRKFSILFRTLCHLRFAQIRNAEFDRQLYSDMTRLSKSLEYHLLAGSSYRKRVWSALWDLSFPDYSYPSHQVHIAGAAFDF